jgi:hypothetical protein
MPSDGRSDTDRFFFLIVRKLKSLRPARLRRQPAVHTINRLLISMSEFGDKLPASTVVYALAAICGFLYAAWSRWV